MNEDTPPLAQKLRKAGSLIGRAVPGNLGRVKSQDDHDESDNAEEKGN